MKKTLLKTILRIVSGICAALMLADVFCAFYYSPAVYEQDEYRATDNIRLPGSVSRRATEGLSFVRIDRNGYNDPEGATDNGMRVLLMGSSHTEGLNLAQEDTISGQLSRKLADSGLKGSVYNIGISSHTLTRNIANLSRALDRFRPTGYVVLETGDLRVTPTMASQALNDTYDRLGATKDSGRLAGFLSRSPFLCTVYRQYQYWTDGQRDGEDEEKAFDLTDEQLSDYRAGLAELFRYVLRVCDGAGVCPVIVYHPHLVPEKDGTARADETDRIRGAFAAACADAGIAYIDLTDDFLNGYETDARLPHGFANTVPGTGHLNAYGCGLFADAVCGFIAEQETGVSAK